jgi:hypothetical protein
MNHNWPSFCWIFNEYYATYIDWLFAVLRPAQEFFTYMETSPLPVKGCKFRPMFGAQGLWTGRDLYRATPTVTRDLGFFGLIRRTAPFSRLLLHTRGCGGSILAHYSMYLECDLWWKLVQHQIHSLNFISCVPLHVVDSSVEARIVLSSTPLPQNSRRLNL